jgi:hypothetical protein
MRVKLLPGTGQNICITLGMILAIARTVPTFVIWAVNFVKLFLHGPAKILPKLV